MQRSICKSQQFQIIGCHRTFLRTNNTSHKTYFKISLKDISNLSLNFTRVEFMLWKDSSPENTIICFKVTEFRIP